MSKKAVVLLSGGLDSSTVLFLAKRQGYDVHALAFDYGQRHRKELASARRIARFAKASCTLLKFDLPWGGSALLDKATKLPAGRSVATMSREIPSTYVPARNTIFLSFALSFAETLEAEAIFIGANALDFSGYPDCRPVYYKAFQKMLGLATKAGARGKKIVIKTPLLRKSKSDIVLLAGRLKVPLRWTWSCYAGGAAPCGVCDSCILRRKGFEEAGVSDHGR